MYIADLHIHSRFSRATSRDGDAPHLDFWARRKGIQLIGTGDFTHPAWRAELKEQLVPAEEGLYTLRQELCLPGCMETQSPRFVVTGEISSIYKKDGKTRKVHNVIILPSLEAADELSARLEAVGNIHSDGRPILGLDSRDLLELTLEVCPDAEFIPAHIWTPHFSMFGAFSGFDSIEECFGDLTPHIHAAETGLSSDPPMNWRVSQLDGLTLVSHSDAHSPSKLGREADLFDTGLSYPDMVAAIRTGSGFAGTIEFFPEEGKYHLDGHRSCGICLTPAEAAKIDNRCPVCGKKLTIGVEHRVEELADRPSGFRPECAKPYESLVPLPEVIAACIGSSASSKKTLAQYEELLSVLGPEFYILREAPAEDIERAAGPCVAEGIRRLRAGRVMRRAGFDGEYGVISLLTPSEIEQLNGQLSLFGVQSMPEHAEHKKHGDVALAGRAEKKSAKASVEKTQPADKAGTLNPEQLRAASAGERIVAVVAGPGTGKTKTLISRIEYLINDAGVRPEEITAVTFTNQAASEMHERLEKRLGKRAAAKITLGTFHAICLGLLGSVRVISEGEALDIAEELLRSLGRKMGAKKLVSAVSKIKNGVAAPYGETGAELYEAYCARLRELGVLDFDDLLSEALNLNTVGRKSFKNLLIDEFQDINDMQFELIKAWSMSADSLFVIGDPDQSIYGFRGSTGRCFERLHEVFPEVCEIRLTQNYRSSPEILKASLPVISNNPGGARGLDANCPSGEAVRVVKAADEFGEGIFIAKEISRITGGVDMLEAQSIRRETEVMSFSDIAVLCRTHRQLELIEKCLRHDDIPCVISGRDSFLESDDVRGVLSFFHSLEDITDSASVAAALRLLWDCPADLIETAQRACTALKEFDVSSLCKVLEAAARLGTSNRDGAAAPDGTAGGHPDGGLYGVAQRITETAPEDGADDKFDSQTSAAGCGTCEANTAEAGAFSGPAGMHGEGMTGCTAAASEQSPYAGIEFPLSGWLERAELWLPLVKGEKPHRLIQKWEDEYGASAPLDKLRNTAVFYSSFKELWNALILGEEADLRRASGKSGKSGAVCLMTLHGAKGLEFDAVFLAGVTAGRLPLESHDGVVDVEEERRLMYVGMTRAKKELIITTSSQPSVFLSELPEEVIHESASRRRPQAEQLSLF